MSSSSSNFVDEHIIMNIASRLPVESVLRCRCVCKSWRSLLHEPYFTQLHIDRTLHQQQLRETVTFFTFACIPNTNLYDFFLQDYYYLKYAAVEDEWKWQGKWKGKHKGNSSFEGFVIGSINGLICFDKIFNITTIPSLSIYNPITREYLNLPSLGMNKDDHHAIGFGYHPFKNQYKIVRIILRNFNVRWVQIYTLGTGGKWRDREDRGIATFTGAGVYANGAIYWLSSIGRIISFDMEDEKFRMIEAPLSSPNRCIGYELAELVGEGLCAIERSNVSTNIYVMNKDGDDGKCLWSKKFSIPVMAASNADIQYKPIAVTRKGRVLCLCNKKSMICFDPRTATIESLGDVTCFDGWCPIVSYTKSFVSLKSLGEDVKIFAKKKRSNIEKRRRNRYRKTEMIKLFTSLLQNWVVD